MAVKTNRTNGAESRGVVNNCSWFRSCEAVGDGTKCGSRWIGFPNVGHFRAMAFSATVAPSIRLVCNGSPFLRPLCNGRPFI